MSSHSFGSSFFAKATATLRSFCSKTIGCYGDYIPTGATTFPACVFTVFDLFKNFKATEFLSDKINEWWHGITLLVKVSDKVDEAAGRVPVSQLFRVSP